MYTIEPSMHICASLAGAPDRIRDHYSSIGLPLGEAFQLRDDVLGVFGDPAETGKPAGDDLREGKRTYLVAVALERAAGNGDRELLTKALGNPDLDDEDVLAVREVIVQSGALAATEERIEELTTASLVALDRAELADEAATVLHELAAASVYRST